MCIVYTSACASINIILCVCVLPIHVYIYIYIYIWCNYAGAEYKAPETPFFSAGERALLEMDLDLLKSGMDAVDAWDNRIAEVHVRTCKQATPLTEGERGEGEGGYTCF